MLTRTQKEEIVKGVAEEIRGARSVVFVNYCGLTVAEVSQIKRDLREKDASYRVLKKRLLELAAKIAGVEIDAKSLDGQVAVVFSRSDEVSGAKVMDAFVKKTKSEHLKVLGGILEGKILNADEAEALAKILSREELLAKLVGSLNAPISGFVQVLSGNMRGLVQVLRAVSEQKA